MDRVSEVDDRNLSLNVYFVLDFPSVDTKRRPKG